MGKEPITIKKTKLTLKAPVAESPAPESPAAEVGGGAAPSVKAKPSGGGGSGLSIFQVVVLVFAILALSSYAILLVLQAKELSFYDDAFPKPSGRPAPAAPAATEAPVATEKTDAPAPAVEAAAPAEAPAAATTTDAPPAAPVAPAAETPKP